jgi:hypothetical protein
LDDADANLSDCTFDFCSVHVTEDGFAGSAAGGAISILPTGLQGYGNTTLTRCVFTSCSAFCRASNATAFGGALHMSLETNASRARFSASFCTFLGCSAEAAGSGLDIVAVRS